MADNKATLDNITKREKAKLERTNRNLGTYTNSVFKEACAAIGIPATARQASKYNNGYGAAFNGRK